MAKAWQRFCWECRTAKYMRQHRLSFSDIPRGSPCGTIVELGPPNTILCMGLQPLAQDVLFGVLCLLPTQHPRPDGKLTLTHTSSHLQSSAYAESSVVSVEASFILNARSLETKLMKPTAICTGRSMQTIPRWSLSMLEALVHILLLPKLMPR